MTTVNTIGNFQAAGNAPGVVPLGAIIAMTSGLTGAMAIPASGVVSNGYMRADGTAIPANNTVSGTPPNLSTSIFLRGATTFSGTGGGTATLIAANIPSLTSTGTVTSAGTTVANNTGINSVGHTHTYSGTTTTTGSTHTHQYNNESSSYGLGGATATGGAAAGVGQNTNTTGSTHTHTYSGTTDSISQNHTHSIPSLAVNSGQTVSVTSTGTSGTAFNVIPNYIDVVYLIRVS